MTTHNQNTKILSFFMKREEIEGSIGAQASSKPVDTANSGSKKDSMNHSLLNAYKNHSQLTIK